MVGGGGIRHFTALEGITLLWRREDKKRGGGWGLPINIPLLCSASLANPSGIEIRSYLLLRGGTNKYRPCLWASVDHGNRPKNGPHALQNRRVF